LFSKGCFFYFNPRVVDINCDVCARVFSAADRCFPRARLQPPCPGKGYVDVVRKERLYSTLLKVLRGLQTRAVPASVFGRASMYAQAQESTDIRSSEPP